MPVVLIRKKWGIDYYDHGRRVREVVGDGLSKTFARDALHSRLTQIAEGTYLPNKREVRMLIREILDYYYFEYILHKRNGFRSSAPYRRLLAEFGHLTIPHLTRERILLYMRRRQKELTRNGNPVQPATINNEIIFLKAAINFVIKMGKVRGIENPCKGIKLLPANNARDFVITAEEYDRLVVCAPDHIKPVVMCGYFTGCRKSEILGLRKEDVNLFTNTIHIRNPKNGEDRHVPIAAPLREILIPLVRNGAPSEYLFQSPWTSRLGKPITEFPKAWRTACEGAGLKGFRFHDLRHTALTNWHNAGHSHLLIMQASGHKTLSCFQRYLSFRNHDLQKLVGGQFGQQVVSKTDSGLCNAV
jgi:integrase